MIPLVAIVGRPNVGKSTLFNRIVGRRAAIVEPTPGVTRDRHFAEASWRGRHFTLVDTGGIGRPAEGDPFSEAIRRQTDLAIAAADVVILLLDGQEGLMPADEEVLRDLRRSGLPLVAAVNKIDSARQEKEATEFFRLGVETLHLISAEHGRGVGDLLDALVDRLPEAAEPEEAPARTAVAIVGRPNVGKSSLVNRLLGEERAVVSETPGTTRDSIDTPVRVGEREYLLIDTAGIRRRGKVDTGVEHLSVHFALKGLSRADVVVLLIDGKEGVTAQDAHIAGQIVDAGAGCVLAVNKWDAVPPERKDVKLWTRELREQMKHVTYAPVLTLSALTGLRVDRLFGLVDRVAAERAKRVDTTDVNRFLEEVTERTPPPSVRGRDIRIYYATQASVRPPTFVFFVNRPGAIHFSYQRFLANQLRKRYGFEGTPLRLVFRHRSGRWEDTRSGRAPSFKR
ncbi:MAG: ribosome biogenesis GTPase Der [Candidatus Tectomicrobia bacterium]|nr:ribosome biogenesis GTPase Der [Candidatus Tectomicrobia bacterium]